MYIRFVINTNDEDSRRRAGIFHAIRELRDNGQIHDHDLRLLDDIHNWFNDNLEAPDSFSRSSRPNAQAKAISWYKDTAREHIRRMYEIAAVLEAHNVSVEILKTERPGYIVYEDEYQVAAEPFRETSS